MRRREFLGILGGAAAWPVALKAQQAEPVRRVGFFRLVGADLDSIRRYAADLVALAPDVIFSTGSLPIGSLQQDHPYYSNRVHERSRSGWCWFRRKYGPSRR